MIKTVKTLKFSTCKYDISKITSSENKVIIIMSKHAYMYVYSHKFQLLCVLFADKGQSVF